jgi:hypothetical protein
MLPDHLLGNRYLPALDLAGGNPETRLVVAPCRALEHLERCRRVPGDGGMSDGI